MNTSKFLAKAVSAILLTGMMLGSCFEVFNIAWGTGNRVGQFSLIWAVIFTAFCTFCTLILCLVIYGLWNEKPITSKLISFREYSYPFRLFILIGALIIPVWFFQFSIWGIVFQGIYFRLFTWMIVLAVFSIFAARGSELVNWKSFLSALVFSAGIFSIFNGLKYVTDYPFSLGWSEGNRLWDYSVMFGRDRYNYPGDKNIFVFLETGRQFAGALPFLLPTLSIKAARAWVGLLTILPYIVLGIVSFRSLASKKILWVLLSLWTYLFLGQGPIHAPLLFGVILVALAWENPLWAAIPILILSGYYVSISRFTWIFAPAVWIFILEIKNLEFNIKELPRSPILRRAILLTVSNLIGSIILPLFIPLSPTSIASTSAETPGILKLTQNLQENLTHQPLLWYRLFPNPTYGYGILLGALLVALPFLFLLFYLVKQKHFIKNKLQISLLLLSSFAFFGMGLIVSTKIGGGGDLHNLDMFLIGFFFTMVIILTGAGSQWLENIHTEPLWIKTLIVISLILPALGPLQAIRSYGFIEQSAALLTLTDRENVKSLELYPPQGVIDEVLSTLQAEVDQALPNGEILFMDQRQLLTFGFIANVPLVPDYDKKVLMEQALSSDQIYFDGFYRDLKNRRFSLIIAQSQFIVEKGKAEQFGEENDAWVKWVSKPLLCFYEIEKQPAKVNQELRGIGIQLFVPRHGNLDCTESMP